MPRKEGGIGFYVAANPNPGKDGKSYYHVRQSVQSTMTSDELKKQIVSNTTITDADYEGFIEALKSFIPEVLRSGRKLHIEGLGTFFLKMRIAKRKSKDGGAAYYRPKFENPDDITARDVTVVGVGFKPDKELNRQACRVEGFVRDKDAPPATRTISRSKWLKGLNELIEAEGHFTLSDVRYKFGITDYKARTMLNELVGEPYAKYYREKVGATYVYKKTGERI